MPTTFSYRGLDQQGRHSHGQVTADDLPHAIAQLKARQLFPTALTPARDGARSEVGGVRTGFFNRPPTEAVAMFTRQLSNLVGGGVPLMSAFSALTGHTEHPQLRQALDNMQQSVRGGQALWEAMNAQSGIFTPLYINMVKAGEASGQLAAVLTWLADFQEHDQARRLQIRSAMTYPILLLVAGTLAITVLLVVVVPKFTGMYAEFGQALPLPTVILLKTTGLISHWGWILLLAIVLLVVGLKRYASTPRGRLVVDGWRLHLPLLGKVTVKAAMSRFARTTATLLHGGVPLLEALVVVRDVLDNEVLAQATDTARAGMREGERFADRLQQTGVFPPFLTHMIGIGEETGDLRNMLQTVASSYDIEVETTIKSLVSLIEPLIIMVIGGIMGFIILSMLLPVFQINLLGG